MTQSQLDHEVARATGESVRAVRRLGFCLLLMPDLRRPHRASFPQRRRLQARGAGTLSPCVRATATAS